MCIESHLPFFGLFSFRDLIKVQSQHKSGKAQEVKKEFKKIQVQFICAMFQKGAETFLFSDFRLSHLLTGENRVSHTC